MRVAVLLAALLMGGCNANVREERRVTDDLVVESIRRQGCLLYRNLIERARCFERVRAF